MKYLKLFESFENINEVVMSKVHIDKICREYNIKDYTINPDGSVDVNQNVHLWNKKLTKLPLKFNKVTEFSCSYNKLTSLEGSPKEVNGNFSCFNNKLTSFEFAPKIIRGIFNCQHNKINSFEYFPSYIKDEFFCWDNPIYQVCDLFRDWTKIDLLNDFDIFRDEDTDTPGIVMDRLNDFLLTIGKPTVKSIDLYKNI